MHTKDLSHMLLDIQDWLFAGQSIWKCEMTNNWKRLKTRYNSKMMIKNKDNDSHNDMNDNNMVLTNIQRYFHECITKNDIPPRTTPDTLKPKLPLSTKNLHLQGKKTTVVHNLKDLSYSPKFRFEMFNLQILIDWFIFWSS